MSNYQPSLDRLAQLARERPGLLAGPLHLYQEQEGLDDEQLAAIPRLALCGRPRTTHFREDVERIARYIQADMLQLAMVIRAAESREALGQSAEGASPTLLAARDYDEDDEDE